MSEQYYSLKVLLDGGKHYSVRYVYFKTEEERETHIKFIQDWVNIKNDEFKYPATPVEASNEQNQ